jgi:hypothetical protein
MADIKFRKVHVFIPKEELFEEMPRVIVTTKKLCEISHETRKLVVEELITPVCIELSTTPVLKVLPVSNSLD